MRLLPILLTLILCAACAAPPPPAPTAPPIAPAPPPAEPAPRPPSFLPPTPDPQIPDPAWGQGLPLAAAFSPDGQVIAVAAARELRLHAAADLAVVRWAAPLSAPPSALAFSPDAALIAVAVGAAIELRAPADGALLRTIRAGAAVADLAIAPGGALLAAALRDGRLAIWRLPDAGPPQELAPEEDVAGDLLPGPLAAVAFSPNGDLVVSGDVNGNVLVWQVAEGALAQTLSIGSRVAADVAFSPDGLTIAAASEGWRSEPGAAWLWPVEGGEPRWLTVEDEQALLAPALRLAFSPDSAELTLGAADGSLLRWSLIDGSLTNQLFGHRAAITALAYSPVGDTLLSASRDGSLRTWDALGVETGRHSDLPAISAVALAEGDRPLVAAAGEDGSLRIWQPGAAPGPPIDAHLGRANALAVSPDRALIASAGDDGAIRLWGLPGGEPWGELRGHSGPALSLAFSADGALLASGGADGTVRLWRLPEGVAERTIVAAESDGISDPAILSLAFGPDGVIAAASPDQGVARWSAASGEALAALALAQTAWVQKVAYSPDGAQLAALASDGQLALWRLSDGALLGVALAEGATDLGVDAERRLFTIGGAAGLRRWSLGGDTLAAAPVAPVAAQTIAVGATMIAMGSAWGTIDLLAR